MASTPRTPRRGLPRVPGGEPWPPAGPGASAARPPQMPRMVPRPPSRSGAPAHPQRIRVRAMNSDQRRLRVRIRCTLPNPLRRKSRDRTGTRRARHRIPRRPVCAGGSRASRAGSPGRRHPLFRPAAPVCAPRHRHFPPAPAPPPEPSMRRPSRSRPPRPRGRMPCAGVCPASRAGSPGRRHPRIRPGRAPSRRRRIGESRRNRIGGAGASDSGERIRFRCGGRGAEAMTTSERDAGNPAMSRGSDQGGAAPTGRAPAGPDCAAR